MFVSNFESLLAQQKEKGEKKEEEEEGARKIVFHKNKQTSDEKFLFLALACGSGVYGMT
jgi:hypothetical protein